MHDLGMDPYVMFRRSTEKAVLFALTMTPLKALNYCSIISKLLLALWAGVRWLSGCNGIFAAQF